MSTRPAWYHRENGFSDPDAMEAAHEPILALASTSLLSAEAAVLDLGCGNGALLANLCARLPAVTPWGVDRNGGAIKHAHTLLPRFARDFVTGDIFDVDRWSGIGYQLVILMVGRLIEAAPSRRALLLEALRRSSPIVLLYSYDRPTMDEFRQLVEATGFRCTDRGRGACTLAELPS